MAEQPDVYAIYLMIFSKIRSGMGLEPGTDLTSPGRDGARHAFDHRGLAAAALAVTHARGSHPPCSAADVSSLVCDMVTVASTPPPPLVAIKCPDDE